MLSIPPATTIFASPAPIIKAPRLTAFSEEAQTLLTLSAGTEVGSPALSAACRAGIWPIPAVITVPVSIFCAGPDLKAFTAERPALDAYADRRQLADLFNDMTELGKPTIARVNGHALAGGLG